METNLARPSITMVKNRPQSGQTVLQVIYRLKQSHSLKRQLNPDSHPVTPWLSYQKMIRCAKQQILDLDILAIWAITSYKY